MLLLTVYLELLPPNIHHPLALSKLFVLSHTTTEFVGEFLNEKGQWIVERGGAWQFFFILFSSPCQVIRWIAAITHKIGDKHVAYPDKHLA